MLSELHGAIPVSDAVFEAIQNRLGIELPAGAKTAIWTVNAA